MVNSTSADDVLDRSLDVPSAGTGLRGFLGRNKLKSILVTGDLGAVFIGYSLALWATGFIGSHVLPDAIAIAVVAVVAGFSCIRSQGLFLARVSTIRVVELTRAIRAVVMLGAVMLVVDRVFKFDVRIKEVATASAIVLILLVIWRSAYRSWLTTARTGGKYCRRMVVIGADQDAKRLVQLVETHQELGIRIVGVIGSASAAARFGLGELWIGELRDAEHLVEQADTSGVLVSPHGISPERLNVLVREFQRTGVHVFLSSGMSGIAARRIRSISLAYEPMLYVEAPTLARMQMAAKRVFDLLLGAFGLVVASPVMMAVAIAVKVSDGGPVFFRQQRVGFDGAHFGLIKFRTMVVEAESMKAELTATNERNGPLFKMGSDPRVTRVGSFLRQSSLDELPQLFNVLKGQMSLVGPRPALPAEVKNFPEALRAREQVMPGITGLWQVEARDNPSFEAYSRLDIFYVENWSLTLDLMILLGTFEQIVTRLWTTIFGRDSSEMGQVEAQVHPIRSVGFGSLDSGLALASDSTVDHVAG